MVNSLIHVHNLSPGRALIDLYDGAAALADSEAANGFALRASLEALGAGVLLRSKGRLFGQLMVTGAVRDWQAQAVELHAQSTEIAAKAASMGGGFESHEYQQKLTTYVEQDLAGLDPHAPIKDALQGLIAPLSGPTELEQGDYVNLRASAPNKPQVMYMMRPAVA